MGAEYDEVGLPLERSEEELEERQERELQELEGKVAAHISAAKAAAGKGKKAKAAQDTAEREAEQWQYDLRLRHADELERLREHLAGNVDVAGSGSSNIAIGSGGANPPTRSTPAADGPTAEELEEERVRRKKEKALKKRQDRAAKEAEREAAAEREKLEAGPSARATELAQLTAQLARCELPLRVLEVAADGHCLYHAIGDQLRRVRPDLHCWSRPRESAHLEVRKLCAASLLERSDEYAPFAELKNGEDFAGYCGRVESSADWGGELELRALADGLRVRILVHRAGESKPLALGEQHHGAPLQVTYHRHYYALGEHYNSAVPRDD